MMLKAKEIISDRSMKIRFTKIINTVSGADVDGRVNVSPYDEDTGDSDATFMCFAVSYAGSSMVGDNTNDSCGSTTLKLMFWNSRSIVKKKDEL